MTKILSLFIFLLSVLAPLQGYAAEEILKFHSDIEVMKDGSMEVTENITVRAEGRDIRRGIYRDFPTTYKDRLGHKYKVGFEVLEVRRDGDKEPYHTKKQGNGERVYIGSPDVNLKPGVYRYTLKYRTDRQLGFFEDHDELYWNVTGNGWDFPIREASATVHLPGNVLSDEIQLEAYTGPQGSTAKDYRAQKRGEGNAQFQTTRPLGRREGLTIVVGWPKGVVREPGQMERAGYFLWDNLAVIAGLLGWGLIFLYYFLVWLAVGKDPAKGTIFPRFEPPKDFSPAATRFVLKMGFDNKAFAAALLNLAVKGYITIQEKGRAYVLNRTSGSTVPLLPGEKKLLNKLPEELELKQKNHATIRLALRALKSALTLQCEKIYFRKNSLLVVPGILFSLGILIWMSFMQRDEGTPVVLFLTIWLTFWTIGVLAVIRGAVNAWRAVAHGPGNPIASVIGALAATFGAFMFSIGEVVGLVLLGISANVGVVIVLFLLALTNYLFYVWLKAPTHNGRKLLDEVEGFRMFLTVTEEERLKLLHPPDRTPELFEKYLPYALALDVEQLWAEQFSDVLTKAGTAGKAYSPAWYSGSYSSGDYGGLATSLGSGFTSVISSSSTAPGSSSGFSGGGGGGGSSGGGGGGGGGGGW